jgi:hypothetical protein
MRRIYVAPMRWMVIYEYEVPGGALNLNSTKLPRSWSPSGSSLSRKIPYGRAGYYLEIKPRIFSVPNRILRDSGTELLNTYETGAVPGRM